MTMSPFSVYIFVMMKSIVCMMILMPFFGCSQPAKREKMNANTKQTMNLNAENTAVFAAGCFWCVEAPLLELDGVDTVISGYIGGHVENPTYAQVCTGSTGHAEAVKITYDPNKISFDQLLEVFFLIHDPTQLNRQGNDVGTQYRSAIFPVSEEQSQKAKYYIQKLNQEKVYPNPIVTTIEELDVFYNAENYHQNYYALNPNEMYCRLVIKPKMEKFTKVFADRLKKKK